MIVLLSIIISCHNCRPYIKRLLNSILTQEFDDLEVIVSDDNSTDGFMEEVDKYKSLLNIKYFHTDEHKLHCPGNTRLDGLKHATGEWVTFIDHDDEFLPNTFKNVFENLKKNSQYNIPFIYSPVQRLEPNGNLSNLEAVTWLHGNFYKRQFLIDNNINFKEDLFGNEDLYFNNLVNGTIAGLGISMLKMDQPIYRWHSNLESLSNKQTGDLDYTEKYFGDYLTANSEPHMICYDRFPDYHDHFRKEMTQALLYSYFYYQRALYNNKKAKVSQMLTDIKNTFNKIKEKLNITTKDIITELTSDVERYSAARDAINSLSGKFIETQSLSQFYKSL